MGEEVRGVRSTNWSLQNSHGDVNYSIESGGAKEFIHITHGHVQSCANCLREQGGAGWREAKREILGQL